MKKAAALLLLLIVATGCSNSQAQATSAVDWEAAIVQTQTMLTDPQEYSYVDSVSISVDEEVGLISVTAVLSPVKSAEAAAEFAEAALKELCRSANENGGDYSGPGDGYYGALYDDYAVDIGVYARGSDTEDIKDWWVSQSIPKGTHREVRLQKKRVE